MIVSIGFDNLAGVAPDEQQKRLLSFSRAHTLAVSRPSHLKPRRSLFGGHTLELINRAICKSKST